MPRQIIIEIGDDGKSVILRKDETASVFERSAVLSGIAQAQQDIPVIPFDNPEDKEPLSVNNNNDGPKPNRLARSGVAGGNSAKRDKSCESK